MEYHAQSPNACLAYAAFNLGAVDLEAVEEYEQLTRGKPTLWLQQQWAQVWAPWIIAPMLDTMATWGGKHWQMVPPLETLPKGRGILVVMQVDPMLGQFLGMHALAYDNGAIMDSSTDAPGRIESWDEMQARLKARENSLAIPVTFAPFKWRRNES